MSIKKDVLVFPVILHIQKIKAIVYKIPDIDDVFWTQRDSMKDIMAQDAIGIMLDDNIEYPKLEDIETKVNDIKTVVYIDMEEYRRNNPKTVRKNILYQSI